VVSLRRQICSSGRCRSNCERSRQIGRFKFAIPGRSRCYGKLLRVSLQTDNAGSC
jgi:hypothetical protein